MVGTAEECDCFLPSDLVAVDDDDDDCSSSDEDDMCATAILLPRLIILEGNAEAIPPAVCLDGTAKASAWSKLKLRRRAAVTQTRDVLSVLIFSLGRRSCAAGGTKILAGRNVLLFFAEQAGGCGISVRGGLNITARFAILWQHAGFVRECEINPVFSG